ncbi:MAG TPA: glycine--tRNA ligase subunit alpha, partial [bacterium (Candidatus Stahlbacteria)]|nr:glycine--tRNA ligase subunit alpha [Candidatus Stahlbacteria bacterium]
MNFQDVIMRLQDYWAKEGCLIYQPYNSEVGAGTFNPGTFIMVMKHPVWNCAYVEVTRRPRDGRYGKNPNRAQQYYQFQVIMKPTPADILDRYLKSLEELGIK